MPLRFATVLRALIPGGLACLIATGCVTASHEESAAQRLLRQMYLASGGRGWSSMPGAVFSGRCDVGGLTGTFTQIVDFRAGRDVLTYDVGPLRGAAGTARLRSWWMDEKGLVTVEQAPDALIDAATESYEDRNGWFDPRSAARAVYRGVRHEGANSYDIVQVQPPAGRLLTLWLDSATHLLERVQWFDADHRDNVQYFSDYRRIDDVVYPFTQRSSSGDPASDVTTVITSYSARADLTDQDFQPPRSDVRDARLLTDAPSATIPFELRDGMIVVDVSIGGSPPLPFVLDSGAFNVLTPAVAARLHLHSEGSVTVDGVGNQQVNAHMAMVPSYRVGRALLLDQRFAVLPLPDAVIEDGQGPAIAGLIGYELFRRFVVRVDYEHHELTLWSPAAGSRSIAGAKLPLIFNGRDCFITAAVDGKPGLFRVDTGDDGSLTLFGQFYLDHRPPLELPGLNSFQDGVGGSVATLLTRIQSLAIGPFTLQRPLTQLHFARAGAFASANIAGNLGVQILRNFVLTFDYPDQALYLSKSAQFGATVPYNRSGMLLDVDEGGQITVTAIDPFSPAARAGLQRGDHLVVVDGQPATPRDFARISQQLSRAAGTPVTIDIMRHGLRLRLQLTLQELLPLNGPLSRLPPQGYGSALLR
jgi:Aspartyl protease/PDZ domain